MIIEKVSNFYIFYKIFKIVMFIKFPFLKTIVRLFYLSSIYNLFQTLFVNYFLDISFLLYKSKSR